MGEEASEDNKDKIDDTILILSSALKSAKKQKASLEKYCAEIAGTMDQLKTNSARRDLAKITQMNYKKMIELEINIAEMEKNIKDLKLMRMLMF